MIDSDSVQEGTTQAMSNHQSFRCLFILAPLLHLLPCRSPAALAGAQGQGQADSLIAGVFDWIVRIWNMKLVGLGDAPLTPGQVIVALIILLIGLMVIRRIANVVNSKLLSRFALDANALLLIDRTLRYVLIAILILLALDIVNIPLTIFTFLGGAVAIALGFGGQALLGNFISGFILMVEKPIKLGDLIDFQGTYGKVVEIGGRCTTLRTPDNLSILVPNSKLVENPLINWTLSDFLVRSNVTVGVAYGSPTRKVEELVLRSAQENQGIQKAPPPVVLFTDFGDNSLQFVVHFWVHMKDFMDRQRVESEVRFRIDELFRENGITISYPQRDVHLSTLSPLDIRLSGAPPTIDQKGTIQ